MHGPVLWVASIAALSLAQSPYTVTVSSGTYTDLQQGATYTPVAYDPPLSNWDEGAAAIPLPFPFTFFGTSYNGIYAYTNGFLSFLAPPGPMVLGPPFQIPDPNHAVHAFLGVMWTDLDGGANPEIRAALAGSPPNRIFVIQEKGLIRRGDPNSSVSFQVRLHETSNLIEIIFGPNNGIIHASTAIENATGTEGQNLLDTSPTCGMADCACNPGFCDSSSWPQGRTLTVSLPSGPDLAGSIRGPRGAYPGTTFNAVIALQNLGLTASGSFDYQVLLSPSSTSTAGATLLAMNTVADLAAASTLTATLTLTMPAMQPVGVFDLALLIDPAHRVPEPPGAVTVAFDTGGIATAPQLGGTLAVPNASGPGETITAMLHVESQGAPVPAPIHIAFYLSQTGMIDGTAVPMGTTMFVLPDGFRGDTSLPLTIPPGAAAGDDYVLAQLDDQNMIPQITRAHDLVISNVISLHLADLAAYGFTGGEFAFLGLPFPLGVTLQNQGGATARDFTNCVAISRSPLISILSDPILLTTTPMTVHPGDTVGVYVAPVIPAGTATGAWYFGLVANCGQTVMESNLANNIARSANRITIRTPAPDFVPAEIDTAMQAAAGEAIPISVRVQNVGNAAGAIPVRLVISDVPGVVASDQSLYDTPAPIMLAPGTETTISVWAALPIDLLSGTYYVGAIVDPAGTADEIHTSNKTIASAPLVVSGANLAVVTPPLPPAVIGVPYDQRFDAAGGTGPYRFLLHWDMGHAPMGLAFDAATAELKGTPLAADEGSFGFQVQVSTDSLTAERHYTLFVTQPTIPLMIVSSRLPPALAGEHYAVELVAVGGVAPYHWSIVGAAPAGINVSDSGELGGIPQVVRSQTFLVAVKDSAGARAQGAVALDVIDPNTALTITTADIPTAVSGLPYEYMFTAQGGAQPYTWSLEASQPIPGLQFMASTADLTGTPTIAGDYPIIVEVMDAHGLLDRNAFVLRVLAPGDLMITTGLTSQSALPLGHVGLPYLDTDGTAPRIKVVRRSGGDASGVWTVVDGALPPGLALDAATGAISGTPTTAGQFPFRVLVTGASKDFAFSALIIDVQSPNGTVTPVPTKKSCGCAAVQAAAADPTTLLAWLLIAVLIGFRRPAKRCRRLASH